MNKLLASLSETDEFVKDCLDLENLPAVPPYWKRMRKQNQAGQPLLGVLQEPAALKAGEFEKKMKNGAIVLDCRSPEAFGGSHIPESLNVGVGSSFPTWAGTVLPADMPYLLVLEKPEDLWEVCWELLRIGYDLPEGWLAGGMMSWRTAAKPLDSLPNWTVWKLREQIEKDIDLVVLDVRQPQEWANGHIKKALHITGAELPARFSEIPGEKQVAVICGSGYRSSVAGSFLKNKNFKKVASIIGGMSAWKKAEFPTD
jgi:hydroxyacylglutathione hydrolase